MNNMKKILIRSLYITTLAYQLENGSFRTVNGNVFSASEVLVLN